MNNNFFKNKKVVVTGAGGFIGSHLTERLLELGAKVTALVHYNCRSFNGWLEEKAIYHDSLAIVSGDIRDPFQINELLNEADTVFHLAALIGIPFSYKAPQSYLETNLNGTLNILEATKNKKVRKIIVTSTSEVYGTAIQTPMNEKHPLQAQSPYSASKIAADMLAYSYACAFETPVTIVRPFNTFGPRQSARAVIPTVIEQALSCKTIKIGDLSPIRDFNFVSDTVEGFIKAAQNGVTGETYNLATGKGITIGEMVEAVAKILNIDCSTEFEEIRKRPVSSEVMCLIGDASKAVKELDWQPKVKFEEGIKQTIQWFEKLHKHSQKNYQFKI